MRMKIMKEENEQFKKIRLQKIALLELLGNVKELETELWNDLHKKYKLSKEKKYVLNNKTLQIKEIFS